jgi:hypothetical protein
MSGIRKLETENFTKDRPQVGQSDRYSSFKEAVEAEAAEQNVGRLIKPAAVINELEQQQEILAKIETKLRLYRECDTADMECAAEQDRYWREGGEDNRQIYEMTKGKYEEARIRAEIGRALYWGDMQREELKEQRIKINTLTKQRHEDNKGCGTEVQKITTMVDRDCFDQIGAIQRH